MRKRHWILTDILKRKIFLKYELKKIILKSIIKNTEMQYAYRLLARYHKNFVPRRASINQQVNKCFLTGRPWYVNKYTRYSRFKFRLESYKGNIPGFKRASW